MQNCGSRLFPVTCWRFGITLILALQLVYGCTRATDQETTCELSRPVVFGDLDWDSNRFHTRVAQFIVKHGYGCRVDTIQGSTLPLLAAMGRQRIDVTMEIWKDNYGDVWTKLTKAKRVVDLGVNFPDGVQGWYVPRYVVEGDPERKIEAVAPGLKRVEDLPKYKGLFTDPEEPSKGRFYNCIAGWACEVVNSAKLKKYGLLDSYTNFHPGTAAALDSAVSSAYKRGVPILAYYWEPTWLLGRYDMVRLKEPPFDAEEWKTATDPDKGRATSYPVVAVAIGVTMSFAKQAPKLVEFLSKYETTSELVSKALAHMQALPDKSADKAAEHFLVTNSKLWTQWVPPDVAALVKEALDSQ